MGLFGDKELEFNEGGQKGNLRYRGIPKTAPATWAI